MKRSLRPFLLPSAVFLIIAALAWSQWSKVIRLKRTAVQFHENSDIRIFKRSGERLWQGKLIPTYEYDLLGETLEFPTHTKLDLPADGRVRVGFNPLAKTAAPNAKSVQRGQLVVPINGPDTPNTVYRVFRGHDIAKDFIKPSVLTVAAIFISIAVFFLQRLIFKDFGKAFRRG